MRTPSHGPEAPPTIEVPTSLAGVRVDRAVAMLTDATRAEAAELIGRGAVVLDDRVVEDGARRLREGDRLSIDRSSLGPPAASVAPEPAPDVPFTVVYEDDEIIVVDKPPGIVVHPGAGNRHGTLVAGLLARFPELAELPLAGAGDTDRPGIVHRLDKETSGLLVVARTPGAHRSLTAQLVSRTMGRTYLAIVLGRLEAHEGTIDAPIGRSSSDPTKMSVSRDGRTARTHYSVKARFERPFEATSLELRLETGRTHQIRVHVAAIGHPVLGDKRYGGVRGVLPVRRPMLHAAQLRLTHPVTGEAMSFDATTPGDLTRALTAFS